VLRCSQRKLEFSIGELLSDKSYMSTIEQKRSFVSVIHKLKASWIVLWWAIASLIFWFPIAVTGILGRTGRLSFKLCQAWMWLVMTVAFVRVEVIFRGNVDMRRSYVIVSNHQSLCDIPALMLGLGLQFRWVIKKSFIYVLWAAGQVFIDRSNAKRSIKQMDRAAKRLPPGVSVAVFPEGTRSDDGLVRRFKSGGFLMAIRNGIPILPVTVNGSWKIMPSKRSMSFSPGPIQVVVGTPIDTSGYTRKTMKDLMERTRDAVVANLDSKYPQPNGIG
jgi:1-acyl-sn-glycerol-3-phosphate acyltransferase